MARTHCTDHGAGNDFPGADVPFGMVQWSPDAVTHQHGATDPDRYVSTISHDDESATPGHYGVTLDNGAGKQVRSVTLPASVTGGTFHAFAIAVA